MESLVNIKNIFVSDANLRCVINIHCNIHRKRIFEGDIIISFILNLIGLLGKKNMLRDLTDKAKEKRKKKLNEWKRKRKRERKQRKRIRIRIR